MYYILWRKCGLRDRITYKFKWCQKKEKNDTDSNNNNVDDDDDDDENKLLVQTDTYPLL